MNIEYIWKSIDVLMNNFEILCLQIDWLLPPFFGKKYLKMWIIGNFGNFKIENIFENPKYEIISNFLLDHFYKLLTVR